MSNKQIIILVACIIVASYICKAFIAVGMVLFFAWINDEFEVK